ncbi:MAG: hypothetical protein RL170_1318 [Bacteroidota bacterium]
MINKNNYETFFMSYIDNELNAAERVAVEAFVLSDSKYAEELALFEKTKLQTPSIENIEMEDKIFLYRFPEMQASLDTDFKKSLYKKEAPVRKIVFTPNILRASFAIAALLILFIGVQLFKSDAPIKEKAAIAKDSKEVSIQNENNSIAATSGLALNRKISNTEISKTSITKTNTANNTIDAKEEQTLTINDINNNITSPINTSTVSTEPVSELATDLKINEKELSTNTMEAEPNETVKKIRMTPTIYKEIDIDEDDRTINIGLLEIDGSAFRGITRRVSALLKRNKIEKEK